jgi:rootletin
LIAQNSQLRQQLEESHRTNESLTNDLQKLTNDWENLRDEMLSKEDEWKMEEEVSIYLFIYLRNKTKSRGN